MIDEMDRKEVIYVNVIGYDNFLFKFFLVEYFFYLIFLKMI